MIIVKYLIGIVIFSISFLFIGEFYVWHVNNFESDYPYTTMYSQKEVPPSRMIEDILGSAQNHNVEVFMVERTVNNLFSQEINIYSTEEATRVLAKKSDIIPGNYTSFVLGHIGITMLPFAESPVLTQNVYQLVGSKDDIILFKRDLADKYDGKPPQFPPNETNDNYVVVALWSVVLAFFLLLTSYETSLYKKEYTVRVALGAQATIYEMASQKAEAISIIALGHWGGKTNYILANPGAMEYLRSVIPGLRDNTFRDKVYFIMPKQYATDRVHNEMIGIWESYFDGGYDYETIQYDKNTKVIAIENAGAVKTFLVHNPIIIYNNTQINRYKNIGYVFNSSMYRMTTLRWEAILSEIGFEGFIRYQTNVRDNYVFQWNTVRRALITSICLFLLLLFMELLIIRTVLYNEYRAYAVELSLKKVLGYNLLHRHRKILTVTCIGGVIGLLCAMLINRILGLTNISYPLLCGAILILTEIITIIWYICKLERKNVQSILKGELL
jgi:hypothetical protein